MAARWTSGGRPVVYLAEHPALALLENLVHIEADPDDLPDTYQLLEIDLPDRVSRDGRSHESLEEANERWRSDLRFTRAIGDAWLSDRPSAILFVPSAVVPRSTNALLNPDHPEAAALEIVATIRPAYDRRLFAPRGYNPSPTPPQFPK